jgi:hypothetical protein
VRIARQPPRTATISEIALKHPGTNIILAHAFLQRFRDLAIPIMSGPHPLAGLEVIIVGRF